MAQEPSKTELTESELLRFQSMAELRLERIKQLKIVNSLIKASKYRLNGVTVINNACGSLLLDESLPAQNETIDFELKIRHALSEYKEALETKIREGAGYGE